MSFVTCKTPLLGEVAEKEGNKGNAPEHVAEGILSPFAVLVLQLYGYTLEAILATCTSAARALALLPVAALSLVSAL